MALPPTIPTSFVPKQPVETGGRRAREGTSLFLVVGIVIAGVAILGAGLTFGYEKYLENVRNAKASQLAEEEKKIDQNTVEGFIRLQNRLLAANALLDQHIALSKFFNLLEAITLQNVRFSTLHVTVAADHTAQIQMNGTAKNFNALAAQSSAFAAEKQIRSAIFSQIRVDGVKNTVAFSVTASLDPKLLTTTAGEAPAPAAVETTVQTASSTTGL